MATSGRNARTKPRPKAKSRKKSTGAATKAKTTFATKIKKAQKLYKSGEKKTWQSALKAAFK